MLQSYLPCIPFRCSAVIDVYFGKDCIIQGREKCATNCINQCIFAQKMGYSISVKEIQLQKMYPVVTDKYTQNCDDVFLPYCL